MKPQRSEIFLQGLVAGLLGYAAVVVFFAIANAVAGKPVFYTAALLGSALFYGARDLSQVSVAAGPVLSYNGVHLLVFLALGVAAAWLAELAEHGPHFWYIGAVVLLAFALHVLGLVLALSENLRAALPAWSVLVSGALGSVAMAAYLLVVRPGLRRALRQDVVQDMS
jgi:hypothetical protein